MIPHHKTLRHYRIPTIAWAFVLMWSYVYVVRIVFGQLHEMSIESLVAVFGFLTQAVISTRDILKDLRIPMDDEQ